MEKFIRNKVWKYVLLILVPIFLITQRQRILKTIFKNRKFGCVFIDKIEKYRSDYRFYYTIKIGNNYKDLISTMPQKMIESEESILYKYVPIVYDSTNFKFRVLIINTEQLQEWGMTMDDWNYCSSLPKKETKLD